MPPEKLHVEASIPPRLTERPKDRSTDCGILDGIGSQIGHSLLHVFYFSRQAVIRGVHQSQYPAGERGVLFNDLGDLVEASLFVAAGFDQFEENVGQGGEVL